MTNPFFHMANIFFLTTQTPGGVTETVCHATGAAGGMTKRFGGIAESIRHMKE